ncbi:MAG: ABC transporter substrate-binding protein, partial [Actinomycetota bacterium]|nr:ABC transporter substrate-binding protein [Actinomycetota bacterium]
MRRTALLVPLAAAGLLLSACGGDDDTTTPTDTGGGGSGATDLGLISDGQLTVCSDIPYEPFEFEDADAPSG